MNLLERLTLPADDRLRPILELARLCVSIRAIQGVYIIGMKDQLNIHDLQCNVMRDRIRYIADEMGFIVS